jgi:hypothetical protein
MSCCNQASNGRIVLNQKDIDEGLRFEVEYWGCRQIEVHGTVTGQTYLFSGILRRGLVDPRDAPGILRNQMFRLRGTARKGGSLG